MLVLCWPKLSLCCPMLTLCWPKLPLSCPYVDPMFTYAGLGNALPHSSDRNDGGGDGRRGRDGVGTGWGRVGRRLGGHASITFGYHRRPPARTRAGPGAGARIEGLPPMPPTPESQLLQGHICQPATYVQRRPDQLGSIAAQIHGRKAMQRMRRTQKQKRVYRRAMEARRCGPHMPRMCRETPNHLDTSPNQPKAPKNSLTPLSDALKKDEPQPCNGRPRLDWP